MWRYCFVNVHMQNSERTTNSKRNYDVVMDFERLPCVMLHRVVVECVRVNVRMNKNVVVIPNTAMNMRNLITYQTLRVRSVKLSILRVKWMLVRHVVNSSVPIV